MKPKSAEHNTQANRRKFVRSGRVTPPSWSCRHELCFPRPRLRFWALAALMAAGLEEVRIGGEIRGMLILTFLAWAFLLETFFGFALAILLVVVVFFEEVLGTAALLTVMVSVMVVFIVMVFVVVTVLLAIIISFGGAL